VLTMIFYAAEFTSVFKTISYEKFKQCRPSEMTAGCKVRYIHVFLIITSPLNFLTLVYTKSAPSSVSVCVCEMYVFKSYSFVASKRCKFYQKRGERSS